MRAAAGKVVIQFGGLGGPAFFALACLLALHTVALPVFATSPSKETQATVCTSASKILAPKEWQGLCGRPTEASASSKHRREGEESTSASQMQLEGDGTCYPGQTPSPADPFRCILGSYYCSSALDVAQLEIKNSLVTFMGDLMVNKSLQFEEHDARIKVAGCLTLAPSAVVSLVFSDLGAEVLSLIGDEGYKYLTLIEQQGVGCPTLEPIQIKGSVAGSTCKVLSFATSASQNQVSVKISVSYSKCESGLVVVAVILFVLASCAVILVLLLIFSPMGKLRACR